jgi:hypothetical protein
MIAKKYQEVLAATREYMGKVPDDAKAIEVSSAYWDIGGVMHVSLRQQETRQDAVEAERFHTQVRRALDELAAEGVLVKIGKGDRNIRGYLQTTPQYYTQAQHEHAVAREQARRSEARTATNRWEEIYDKLESRGIPTQSWNRGKPVVLDLAGWDMLLEQLAKGTGGW